MGKDKEKSEKSEKDVIDKEKKQRKKKKFLGKREPTNKSDYSVVIKDQLGELDDSGSILNTVNTTSTVSTTTTSTRLDVGVAHGVRQQPSKLRDFTKPEILKDLYEKTDRGSVDLGFKKVGKGVGEFEGVINSAKNFADAKSDGQLSRAKEMLSAIDTYLTPQRLKDFDEDWRKGEKRDEVTRIKVEATANLRREAKRFLQEPIDTAFLSANLDTAQAREDAHQTRAIALTAAFAKERAPSGSSEVQLIKGADGVAYAFKPIDKESDQSGMIKGAGAVREAMGSAMSNAIRDLSGGGLDFGFPQTQLVSLDDRKGALIEGMQGVAYDKDWLEGKAISKLGPAMESPRQSDTPGDKDAYAAARRLKAEDDARRTAYKKTLEPEFLKMKERASELAQKLPAKEIQKALLCNFAMAQFDIKWDNLMLVSEGTDVAARPFDAGAGFLSDETLNEKGELLATGKGGPGSMLLTDPTNGDVELPSASAPIDEEMRNQFLAINLTTLKKTLDDERRRLATDHGLGEAVLSDKAMARTYKAMANLKEVLEDPNVLTTKDLVLVFCSRLEDLREPT